MAQDQLGLYNEALTLLGQRELASLTEDREPRHRLDSAYNRAAVNYCLEMVRPNFASKIATLSSPSAATTFDWSHAKPSDYVTLMEELDGAGAVYSDNKLDQPIHRYLIETTSILADYQTIYIHYVSNAVTDISTWTPSFFKVVAAYLAAEIVGRISPERTEAVRAELDARGKAAIEMELRKRPLKRSSDSTTTLTTPWRKIYNDALLIMGLEEINSNTDDSNRRAKLDRALNANLVESLLEEIGWSFGRRSIKIQYDPSAEPAWGYTRALAKPTDLHRLHGIYHDEYMRVPLKSYRDEGDYWFCDLDEIYIEYVDTEYLVSPPGWPSYFRRLVAARLAKEVAPSLKGEGADVDAANEAWKERNNTARNVDAMQSPPQVIHEGTWTSSRWRDSRRGGYRGRP